MTIALLTRGMVSVGRGGPSTYISPSEHPILSTVELKPMAIAGVELKPTMISAEDQADDYKPKVTSAQELRPKISGTINLRPTMISAEEE